MQLAGYRQFTWWTHNRLGEGKGRVIPSCIVASIRITQMQPENIQVFKMPRRMTRGRDSHV